MTSVFNPPTLADADSTLAVRLLKGASISVATTALIGAVLIPLTAPPQLWPLYFSIVSVIFLTCLLAFWMMRRGVTQWASWLLVAVIWVGITVTAITSGGVQSTAYIGYVGAIMLAGLLLGGGASVAVTVLSAGVGLTMAVGALNGWLPPFEAPSSLQWWAISALLLAVCALIQQFASGTLALIIKRARDSEANYRMLFEEAPEGILIADASNRFVMANPAACQMLGYSVEEFMGKGLVDLIAPEDLERLPIGQPEEIRASGGRKRERLVAHKDGERVPIIISSRYMADGRYQYILQDITELKQTEAARKRAEEALRQSESVYRRAIEAAGAVPYYLDYRTGQYVFMGDKITEITGYSFDKITPDLMSNIEQEYQLLGEAAGLTKEEAVGRVRAGQIRVWKNDSRIRTHGGESRWVSDTSVQMTDEDGTVVGAIGIVQDITERKQAELALRYSEGLHRRAIEAAGAVPYYRDHTLGAFTFMGEGIRQMTGYGPGEMTPQFFDTLVVERVMMGESASASPQDAIRRARTGQLSIWQCDYKVRRKDGAYRWLADSAVEVLVESGLSRGSVGILQDITERKEALEEVQRLNAELEQRVAYRTEALHTSEARFRATNDASPLGIFVDDPQGECVYTNAVYQNITGLSADQSLGQNWIGAVHPGDRDTVAARWEEACRRSPFRYEQVYRIRRRDGRVVWVSVKASAMRDGETLLGYVGTVEDITARVEAEESLRQRTAQLEAANKELEAFSYSVSHDLRAPLRAMDGFSRLLVEQYSDTLEPEARRYLHKVRDNAQQMGRLIDDLLAFSRLGRHALRLQYITSTDLVTLARRVADEACAAAANRRFKVFVGDLPPCEADYSLLTQVFVNLLTNAVKFTKPRTVAEIEIGSLSADEGPAYFVRDNGVGFDMQYAPKVFGVFQRLHRMEDFEGTGVGLAIVQRIIHRHGGRIWVEAAPDKGATFCFTIGKAPISGE